MAILNNGYVDDAIAYAYAQSRFPANFTASTPDDSYRGSLYIAGDIVNSNTEKFLGEPVSTNTGERAWPRVPRPGVAIDAEYASTFLNGIVPYELNRGYEWLAISISLSPEQFGTTASSSSEVVTTGSGLKDVSYDTMRLGFAQAGTTTINRSAGSQTPIQLQYHYQQALNYLEQLLRPGEKIELPGLDQPLNMGDEIFAALSQFNIVRS